MIQSQRRPSRSLSARLIGLLLAGSFVAGCSSGPIKPAPIVHRAPPPKTSATAPVPPPAAPTTAPAQPAAAEPAPAVTAEPVAPRGIEVRPLGEPPPTAPVAPVPGVAPLSTQPKGLKRPYSDALLAEMTAVGPTVAAAPATVPPRPDAKTEPKSDAKADPKADAKTEAKAEPKVEARPGGPEFDWPVRGKVIQAFAEPSNLGIAIAGKPGEAIAAAADGKVIFAGNGPRGYGNLVIVKHDNDLLSVYGNNRALLVKEGQSVKRGQRIAELGDTGTDRPKLQFEVRRQGKPIDPLKLLPPAR